MRKHPVQFWLAIGLAVALGYGAIACLERNVPDDRPQEFAAARELSESYLIKQIHTNWAKDWYGYAFWRNLTLYNQCCDSDYWEKSSQVIYLSKGKAVPDEYVTFSAPVYGPETNISYGSPTVLENALANTAGRFELVDNRSGTTDVEHVTSESFTLEHSTESSTTQDIAFDVTVGSETTVSGEYAGASFEQKLTATFGSHFGKSETQTTAQNQSTTQQVDNTIVVPAGRRVVITFSTDNRQLSQSWTVDGVLDFAVAFTMSDTNRLSIGPWATTCLRVDQNAGWRNRTDTGGASTIKFASIDDFGDFISGTNTDWPYMADDCSLEQSSHWAQAYGASLLGAKTRTISLTGTKRINSQSSVTLTVLDTTECNDDDYGALRTKLGTDYTIDDGGDLHGLDLDCVKEFSAPKQFFHGTPGIDYEVVQ